MPDIALPDLRSRIRIDTSGVDAGLAHTRGKLAGMSSAIKPLAAAAGAAIAVNFGKASVDAFKESEEAQNRLQQAFAKFPSLADTNIGALRRLNEELARKTRFDDDATASGQAVLANFNLTGQQIASLTPLLQDYAARTGKDLPTAAQDLGKAILGQGRALKAIGINFEDTGSAAGNLDQLMAGLRKQVGGFARSEGSTAAGRAAILSNQFGELQEKVGAALIPAMLKLSEVLLKVVDFFGSLPAPVQTALALFAGLTAAIAVLGPVVTAVGASFSVLGVVFAALVSPIGVVVAAVAGLAAIVYLVIRNWSTIADFFAGIWEKVRSTFAAAVSNLGSIAGTIGRILIAAATGGLSEVVLFFIRNWDRIVQGARDMIGTLVGVIKSIPGAIVAALGDLGELLVRAGKAIIDGLIDGIKSGLGGLKNTLTSIPGKIVEWKGPVDYDRTILVPGGQAIMEGLVAGIQSRLGSLKSTLGGVTGTIAQTSVGLATTTGGSVATMDQPIHVTVVMPNGNVLAEAVHQPLRRMDRALR